MAPESSESTIKVDDIYSDDLIELYDFNISSLYHTYALMCKYTDEKIGQNADLNM